MTQEEKNICLALGNRVNILPGGFDKRFINNLFALAYNNPEQELTEKQREWLFRLVYKYRRQIADVYEKYKYNPFCQKAI